MNELTFPALVVRETERGVYTRSIEEKKLGELPPGEVLVKVDYSSINYKDGLSATGNRGVTRRYPHTPGVDAAGEVVASDSASFRPGDMVVVSCYDLGMNTSGGYGRYIRVPAAWIMTRPDNLTARESMIYGTGGFTAAHSVDRLTGLGVRPEQGKVLVTGATGGVGCFAVAILARLGFRVTAVTGKPESHSFLKDLGAEKIINRSQSVDTSGKLVLKGRWAGVVDTVGGEMLSTALRSTRYGGVVTCCGNVAGPEFSANVYPFILRGITLAGIDSAECPMTERIRIWQRIANEWKIDQLDLIATEITLKELSPALDRILKGGAMGRTVVRLG
ncbi:MAG: YhdH/YhfP family quinone oxidoreductase [Proteobacteria bacterium]|nr:YhdH/YhfP family quinone oxidoreductase [Pseudomonadota bacterium]MBU1686883.1 YhdH/YhfP family quinone oxidoreductase [Pseudomonadota bacterium]